MKYFSNEFINSIPDGEESRNIWAIQEQKYWSDFDACSSRLPKRFVAFYKKYGFHDDLLENFQIVKRWSKRSIYFDIVTQFNKDGQSYEIRYFDVVKFESSFSFDFYVPFGDYLDGEILAVDEHYLSHEYRFYNSHSYFLIWFKKMSFKKIKKVLNKDK